MMKTRNLLHLTAKGLFARNKASRSSINCNFSPKPIFFTESQFHRNYTTSTDSSSYLSTATPNMDSFLHRQSVQLPKTQDHDTAFSCEKILKELVKKFNLEGEKPFKKVMVVAVQHILGTTVEMFRVLKGLGLERVIIGGKSYSTHEDSATALKEMGYTFIEAPDQLGYGRYDSCMQETVTNIWSVALNAMKEKPAELLIILDDGGDLILSTPGKLFNGISYKPKRVIGVEQTRGGSNHRCFNGVPFPIINVAGSFVKTSIEYPLIAEIVSNKLSAQVRAITEQNFRNKSSKSAKPDKYDKPIIGVIGMGTMGSAVAKKFADSDHLVLVHDKLNVIYHKNLINYKDIPSLISNADIIIGCTGTDITAEQNNLYAILNSIKSKYLVSTSSKDIEFNSLLVYIQEQTKILEQTPNPLQDIVHNTAFNHAITILKGGFPINFDNQEHSVSPEKIWPTRAALLSACLMAVQAYTKGALNTADVLKLDASAQLSILQIYERLCPHDPVSMQTTAQSDKSRLTLIEEGSDGRKLKFSLIDHEIDNKQAPSTPIPNC